MTKRELIDVIAKKTGLTKKASREAYETLFEEITKALKRGEKVKLFGFGVFFTKIFSSKEVKPIGGGPKKRIPSRRMPRFRPGTTLKRAVK